MSAFWIDVPAGQTVHLRSTPDKNTSNVITELPRGYGVETDYYVDSFDHVTVFDCIDKIEGFVHCDYLKREYIRCADDELYIPRYSTPLGSVLPIPGNTICLLSAFRAICMISATRTLALPTATTGKTPKPQ